MDSMVGENHGAPDLIGAVAGYKILQMGLNDLSSPYHRGCVWQTPEQTAKCLWHEQFSYTTWARLTKPDMRPLPKKHPAPDKNCKCGLYSFHDVTEFARRFTPIYGGLAVIALTSSTGRIQVHEKGLRAEKQRIEAISVDSSPKFRGVQIQKADLGGHIEAAMNLTESWGLPFVPDWRDLPNVAADMGLYPVPQTLLPDE